VHHSGSCTFGGGHAKSRRCGVWIVDWFNRRCLAGHGLLHDVGSRTPCVDLNKIRALPDCVCEYMTARGVSEGLSASASSMCLLRRNNLRWPSPSRMRLKFWFVSLACMCEHILASRVDRLLHVEAKYWGVHAENMYTELSTRSVMPAVN
jgi:hypothetical protein